MILRVDAPSTLEFAGQGRFGAAQKKNVHSDVSCAARYLPMQAKSGMITISRNILPDTRQIG